MRVEFVPLWDTMFDIVRTRHDIDRRHARAPCAIVHIFAIAFLFSYLGVSFSFMAPK